MASKIDYKTAVLEYLKKNNGKDISRDILMEKTNVSKSRLTEVLQSIRADGYTIITPPRSGIVRLELDENVDVLPTIKDYDIRQWFILFLLSRYDKLTFREILLKLMTLRDDTLDQMKILIDVDSQKKAYDDNTLIQAIRKNVSYSDEDIDVAKDVISVTALRKDLTDLRDQGLISMKKTDRTYYQLSNAAPYIIPVSGDALYEFCQRYEETSSSTSDIAPLKQAYSRIQKMIDLQGNDINSQRFGKINNISDRQIETFNDFIIHSYKTNLISFDAFDKEKSENVTNTFSVGLLFYSVETGNFYILGKNLTSNRIESRRMDWIHNIQTLEEENKEYHNKKYYDIYNEMFSSQFEDTAYKVKVLFQNFGNVTKRFSDLSMVRPGATIRPIQNPPEDCPYNYIYEDTLRGLADFSRYLRGFGVSVLAMEPKELKDKMLFTYNRIIEKYEELNE